MDSFAKKLVPPTTQEGFSQIFVVKTFEEADALLRKFGASPAVNELPNQEIPDLVGEMKRSVRWETVLEKLKVQEDSIMNAYPKQRKRT